MSRVFKGRVFKGLGIQGKGCFRSMVFWDKGS